MMVLIIILIVNIYGGLLSARYWVNYLLSNITKQEAMLIAPFETKKNKTKPQRYRLVNEPNLRHITVEGGSRIWS